ncbi:MAG: hypothetical protein Q4C58_07980 [Eubacteriales bacterium]|nr:hypothetical protein [Eubacteriales bacterium]
MNPTDVYMTVCVVCALLAMMLYEVGMFCVATALCLIGVVCVVLAYCSCAADRPKRRKKKRR